MYVKNSRHFANTQCILLFLYSKTRDFMCMNYVILVFCGIRLTILCPYNRQLIYDRLIIFNTLKLKMHYNISNVCASQAMTAINSSVRIYLLNEILWCNWIVIELSCACDGDEKLTYWRYPQSQLFLLSRISLERILQSPRIIKNETKVELIAFCHRDCTPLAQNIKF